VSRPATPVLERITLKLDKATSECWLWTGARNRGGYGVVRGDDGRARILHRLVYELLVGPVPDGLDLDHLCRVRHCCNPTHLEPVTRQTNVDRGTYAAGVQRRESCSRNHPFTPENTKTTRRGTRTCRTCANERNRRYRERTAA
jgi:hypothetical protein